MHPPGQPDDRCVDLLREDILEAVADAPCAMAAARAAFPTSSDDTVCATACTVPFLLDPVLALRSAGPVPTRSIDLCVRLTVCFLAGIAARVCGDTAASVAYAVLHMSHDIDILRSPGSRVRTILRFTRSSGQDAVATGCALVDGVSVC